MRPEGVCGIMGADQLRQPHWQGWQGHTRPRELYEVIVEVVKLAGKAGIEFLRSLPAFHKCAFTIGQQIDSILIRSENWRAKGRWRRWRCCTREAWLC